MAVTKKKTQGVAKKMKAGGTVTGKGPTKRAIPYPKNYSMSPADSASFRAGYGQPIPGDGYAGISSNPYFKKGEIAAKAKKTMKTGGKLKKK